MRYIFPILFAVIFLCPFVTRAYFVGGHLSHEEQQAYENTGGNEVSTTNKPTKITKQIVVPISDAAKIQSPGKNKKVFDMVTPKAMPGTLKGNEPSMDPIVEMNGEVPESTSAVNPPDLGKTGY